MSAGRRHGFFFTVVVFVLGTAFTAQAGSAGRIHRVANPIKGRYIVSLRDAVSDVPAIAAALARAHGGKLGFVYRYALRGFSVQMTEAQALALSRNPAVELVEEDGVVHADATQSNPDWGLDRIDQHTLPLNSSYTYNDTGSGVRAYIIDTGIRISHNDFGGRASVGTDTIGDGQNGNDCHGHGTHVAGTVGGSTYGVAKQVSLIAVRVLDCTGSGSDSEVIAGINWVTQNHTGPSVANMSLGGSASTSLDNAVANSIASGVTYAIAAGNGNILGIAQDACTTSPARVGPAITVSATNTSDTKASWANYGNCVDVFAPGVSITSDWNSSNTSTNTISGTSMASPHVAGVAALYLQLNPNASPATVASQISSNATSGVVGSAGSGSPNKLLYMSFIGGTPPPSNTPPNASFTSSCTGLTCTFNDTSTDPDGGSIASRSWNFGDGGTGSGQSPQHTYASAGTYTVTLTVTDSDGGASSQVSHNVSVSGSSSITLSASGRKNRNGNEFVDLTWSGAGGANVDVYRNGTKRTTTANDGAYTDNTRHKGPATYTYKVCNAGTQTCSNDATVTF